MRCGVRPTLKGAIFKALAACARDPEIVPHIWAFIEEAQVNYAAYYFVCSILEDGRGGRSFLPLGTIVFGAGGSLLLLWLYAALLLL